MTKKAGAGKTPAGETQNCELAERSYQFWTHRVNLFSRHEKMSVHCVESELASFQVRDAADYLGSLSRDAAFAGLVRVSIMFAQIRLQLLRIEAGFPPPESSWLSLADLFDEEWIEIEEKQKNGKE